MNEAGQPQGGWDSRVAAGAARLAALTGRTAWHSHARGQFLHVTQGIGRFGTRDGRIIEVHPGQTLYTPPGQEHWHAAAPGCFMEHLAMLENADDPAETTTWLEHITDDAYNGTTRLAAH